MLDYLIVGQGLAGTSLALQLIQRNKKVLVINREDEHSSSMIAAGIMNPVTGRRFVKSWRYDEIISFAKDYYTAWEKQFDKKVWKPTQIKRALFSHEEHHDFLAKMDLPIYAGYLQEDNDSPANFEAATAWISIKAARLKIKAYIERSRSFLASKESYLSADFEHADLIKHDEFWQYKELHSRRVIFCEGSAIHANPYFNHLPFKPAKGEALSVKIPGLSPAHIYKYKCFIVPFGHEHTFWIGSTYDWDFESALPTEAKKEELLRKLEHSVKLDYKLLDHRAAIRPTGKDRRPYLGEHPELVGMYLFNALGTKGSSLSPFWANHLIEHMEDGKELDQEINIERLSS